MEKVDDDPLHNYWGLSLFPSAFLPRPPSSPYQDLHSIHTHLRSMALQSPAKLVEHANSLLHDNPELFNPKSLTFDDGDDVVVTQEAEECRQRRPGLGLKRARFSMKPTQKPSVESLLPTVDFDKLKDPLEFFQAHERLENAKREIQKQLGIKSFEQDNAPNRPRQRRPSLLGNNNPPVRYRHRYSTETFSNNDYVPSSQETFGSQRLDPVVENNDKGGACLTSSENEVMDSSAVEENKLDDILDGLLSSNPEDLEGDGAINLLQEKLQIKPIVLEKLSVPDFPESQVIDLKSLRRNSSKPRKALADIDNLVKGMNSKTPLSKDVHCPVQQFASPTPPRSPFASLATLQKHISRSKQSPNPFSVHEIDQLSTRNYSPSHMINCEPNHVGSGKPLNKSSANMIENVTAVGKTGTVLDTDKNCDTMSEKSKKNNSRKSSSELDAHSIEGVTVVGGTSLTEEKSKKNNSGKTSNELDARPIEDVTAVGGASLTDDDVRSSTSISQHIDSNEPVVDMDVDIGGIGVGERVMYDTEDRLSELGARSIVDVTAVGGTSLTEGNSKKNNSVKFSNELDACPIEDVTAVGGASLADDVRNSTSTSQHIDSNEPVVDMDVAIGGIGMGERVMDDTEDRSNVEANESYQCGDKAENVQTNTASMATADQSNPAGYQANAMDKCARRSMDGQVHCLQEQTDGSAGNGPKRVKLHAQKKFQDKGFPRRKSLAAAGTSFESGIRRSTRIRTRPLEYWKGERLVYGRVHESLATVIGVKCLSPGSDGKPTMKVKSYVPDTHKELLDLASLY